MAGKVMKVMLLSKTIRLEYTKQTNEITILTYPSGDSLNHASFQTKLVNSSVGNMTF